MCILSFTARLLKPQGILNSQGRFAFVSKSIHLVSVGFQITSACECDMCFAEKYDYVGRLLKPGESPNDYSETEDEQAHDRSKDE